MFNHTIAAIATSLGEAGIGIIRVSGKKAINIVDQIFKPQSKKSIGEMASFRVSYGKITDLEDNIIDEALILLMRGPRSYTGEDVVEIQCHGGIVVQKRILDLVLSLGARLGEPGEFTKRAFLNGRIDLSQAEAVIDIIRSRTEGSLDLAIQQLEGSLSRRISTAREQLYDIVVRVEASIDFPEDDIPEVEYEEIHNIIVDTMKEIDKLIRTADEGKVYREGIKTVITGKPNVGKSSLLNRLLNENRALVTDIPGTTRDVIEEVLNLNGIPFRLLDTAGIHQAEDKVEQLGVARALDLINEADLILHVLDISRPLEAQDLELLEVTGSKRRIIVINKIDLAAKWQGKDYLINNNLVKESTPIVEISLTIDNLDQLAEKIVELVMCGLISHRQEGAVITRSRHKQALISALEDLRQARDTLTQGLPLDLISIGLYGALEHLGEITGETVRDTMIDQIFAEFCIGK